MRSIAYRGEEDQILPDFCVHTKWMARYLTSCTVT